MHIKMTLKRLLDGDEKIITYYENANALWEEIWRDQKSQNTYDLAGLLAFYQHKFEDKCGGPFLGKEIMAWSGFVHLLEADSELQREEDAIRLRDAFQSSECREETRQEARLAVKMFGLDEMENDS